MWCTLLRGTRFRNNACFNNVRGFETFEMCFNHPWNNAAKDIICFHFPFIWCEVQCELIMVLSAWIHKCIHATSRHWLKFAKEQKKKKKKGSEKKKTQWNVQSGQSRTTNDSLSWLFQILSGFCKALCREIHWRLTILELSEPEYAKFYNGRQIGKILEALFQEVLSFCMFLVS